MERIFIVALLVSFSSATSPPFPQKISLNCNETQFQTEVAINLINEDRDDGFLLRPVRVLSVVQQESVHHFGGFIYYLDLNVLETDCSVLSGKTWKECNHDIPFHELVFGSCKATIVIAKTLRIQKLLNYNCTLGTVPFSTITRMCPDCPLPITISPQIEAKADLLIKQFNKGSNQTHHFKVDNIDRVKTQYVFGQSYFFFFTIMETECLKTETDVNLANCNYLKPEKAHVGFCKGSSYNTPERKEETEVSCEIYNPRENKKHHGHGHGHCDHGPDSSKTEPGQAESSADKEGIKQKGQSNCDHMHGHCPPHRGHKHHGCRHDHHHHHHHPHHSPHHHHHHHHHDPSHHHNDNHHHDPSHHHNDSHHHDPSHHHHHHHHHEHNHTNDGSSSEEHTDHKPFEKRSEGSVQIYYLSTEKGVPDPIIVSLPPPPKRPGRHGKFDNIEFPSEPSRLSTCPGAPLEDLPTNIRNFIFEEKKSA